LRISPYSARESKAPQDAAAGHVVATLFVPHIRLKKALRL